MEHDQVLVSLDFQVVLSCLDLGLELFHFLLLLLQQIGSLGLRILLPKPLNPLSLLNLKNLELFPVVLRLLNSLIDSNKLLILLHLLQSCLRLDLDIFNGTVELLVEHLHLLLVVVLEPLYPHQTLILVIFKLLFPHAVEFLQLFIPNIDVLPQLLFLNVGPQFILILVYVGFKDSHFTHQVFVEGILLHIAEFFSEYLHFFFY